MVRCFFMCLMGLGWCVHAVAGDWYADKIGETDLGWGVWFVIHMILSGVVYMVGHGV